MTIGDSSSGKPDEQTLIEAALTERERARVDGDADNLAQEQHRIVGPEERQAMLKSTVRFQIADYQYERAQRELNQYLVEWEQPSKGDVELLQRTLDEAAREESMQAFLAAHPIFLIQNISGGHGRFVIPKQRLGAEYIPDYLIAEQSSIGIEWHGVELESPLANPITKSGEMSRALNHAIQQITDWRNWLQTNLPGSRNPTSEHGLGLIGITSDLPATILIGRRQAKSNDRYNETRRIYKDKMHIEIHSYDWLVDQAIWRIRQNEQGGR